MKYLKLNFMLCRLKAWLQYFSSCLLSIFALWLTPNFLYTVVFSIAKSLYVNISYFMRWLPGKWKIVILQRLLILFAGVWCCPQAQAFSPQSSRRQPEPWPTTLTWPTPLPLAREKCQSSSDRCPNQQPGILITQLSVNSFYNFYLVVKISFLKTQVKIYSWACFFKQRSL